MTAPTLSDALARLRDALPESPAPVPCSVDSAALRVVLDVADSLVLGGLGLWAVDRWDDIDPSTPGGTGV